MSKQLSFLDFAIFKDLVEIKFMSIPKKQRQGHASSWNQRSLPFKVGLKLLLELDQDMSFSYLKICHAIGEGFPKTALRTEFLH